MSKQVVFRDTTIKVLSVLFATLLWFYVITEQNPVVPKDVTIPVRIINMDTLNKKELIMLGNPNEYTITLKLKGKKEILDTVNQNSLNAYADISYYAMEGENTIPVVINGVPEGVTVTSRSEHSIIVNLDKKIVVQKPITANITGNPAGGLANLTPVLTPSEVVLTGAESIIGKVATVKVDIDIAGVNVNVDKMLPVWLLDAEGKRVEGIKLDTPSVNVTVPIANTKRVPIQLVLDGTPGEGYVYVDQIVQPREILLTGNQQAMDNITVVNSNVININNSTEDLNIPVSLALPEGIQLVNANESISAIIDIQRLVTNTIELSSIEYRNLDEKYIVNDLPSRTVRVVVRGPETLVNGIVDNLKLYVDLSDAKVGQGTYEILSDKSSMIEVLEIAPQQIELDIRSRE